MRRILPIVLVVWWILSITALLVTDKGHWVLALQETASPALDALMIAWTALAEWFVVIAMGAVISWWSLRGALFHFAAYGLTGGVVQVLKKMVFDQPRPAAWFPDGVLTFTANYPVHTAHAFPSGHAATAFAMAAVVTVLAPRRWMGAVAVVLAIGVAVSRVYLKVHFLEDVVAASVLGWGLTVGLHTLIRDRLHPGGWRDRVG